ncbi:MAG: TonB-dependent receptor [Sphingopyxis sp.]|uniref:TonB-dependent receptor n=1 Tax=Sphingopyxis sp. TaxID=1908224 RepID=UPI002AB8BE48|nr:TonB-dependent receptor [Sphingopyxis sp.]MDZ3831483.1 TonB-dependent receptor [Sphingopyxis sp.]
MSIGGISVRGVAGATRVSLLASAMAVVGVVPAHAQDAPQSEETAQATGGEIVVTALKRGTRLQDTPLAISAVTGDALERAGTTSFTELTSDTPSLRIVDNGPGNRRVILRGVVGSGEPTVGVYYDESPVSGSVGTTSDAAGSTPDFRVFDVERAEVLRGPQGTLYGSGSMGGTVRIIYEKPKTDELEGAGSVNLSAVKGGSPGASVDAMVNLPIATDKLALRVVGSYQQFAGYIDNSFYGTKNINDGYSYGGRALLRFTPTEDLTIDLGAYYTKVATDSSRWFFETGRRHTTNARAESGNYDKNRIYSGTLRYDFGPVALTAVSTYFDRDRIVVGDVSDTFNGRATSAGCSRYLLRNTAATCTADQLASYLTLTNTILYSSLYQPQSVKNWSNEIRFSSTDGGPFNWTVGGYMEDRKSSVRSTLLAANPQSGELLPFVDENIYYDRTIRDHLKQKALFAELSYEFFEKLTATVGTRWYEYDKTVGGVVEKGQIHYASVPTSYTEARSKENGFVFKFNLAYEFSRDFMIYAQAAEGFRPGGVNQVIGLPAAMAGYSADSLWNYEIGMKSQPVRGVYFNLTGYQIDWTNMQVSARTSGTGSVFGLISNVGAARIKGVEAELNATPLPGLSLIANVGYTDAKLSEDQVSTIVVAAGRKGDRLPFVPKWNLSASAEYMWPLSDSLEALARIDGSYVGSSYSTLAATDAFRRKVDSYGLVNARFGVQAPDGNWSAHLYVNNIFDALAITTKSSSSNNGGLTITHGAPPRTIGINLTKRFR